LSSSSSFSLSFPLSFTDELDSPLNNERRSKSPDTVADYKSYFDVTPSTLPEAEAEPEAEPEPEAEAAPEPSPKHRKLEQEQELEPSANSDSGLVSEFEESGEGAKVSGAWSRSPSISALQAFDECLRNATASVILAHLLAPTFMRACDSDVYSNLMLSVVCQSIYSHEDFVDAASGALQYLLRLL
jgi:hypothetical protein